MTTALHPKPPLAKTKAFRLSLTGIITAGALFLYVYTFENQKLYQTSRCLTGAKHWYSCYFEKSFDYTTDFYGFKYSGNTRNQVDAFVLYYGAWEKPKLTFLRDVMTTVYSNQGVFLDVGANTGQHSLFMSRHARQVHAFEPYEPVLQRLRTHLETNHLSNVVVHPVGLGDKNAKLPFFSPPETNLGTGSFIPGFNQLNKSYAELEIVVGDEALKKAGVGSVALIKMDIEGFEKPALQGLRQTLTANRPVVLFELTIDPANDVGFKSTGAYDLVQLAQRIQFDRASQFDLVAYPKELEEQIPRKGRPETYVQRNKETPLASPAINQGQH